MLWIIYFQASSLGFCFVNSVAIQRYGAPLRGENGQSLKRGLCLFMKVFLEVSSWDR